MDESGLGSVMHIELSDPNPSTLQLLSPIALQSPSSPPTTISVYDILSPSTPLFASLSIPLSFMLSLSPPLWVML